MTTLVESGRAKQDAELSCSSFSNQEQPIQQQQQQTQSSEKKQHQTDHSAENWSTKLSSVPMSIGFDLSVFATHDRCGRLTLHPVLRAVERQKVQTDCQDRGRNNCARTAPDYYRQETSESPDCNRAAASRRKPQLVEAAEISGTESRANSSNSPVAVKAKAQDSNHKYQLARHLAESPARSKLQLSTAKTADNNCNKRNGSGCSWSECREDAKSLQVVHKSNRSYCANNSVDGRSESRRQYSDSLKRCKDSRRMQASEQRPGPSSELPPGSLAMVVQNLEALLSALDPLRASACQAADSRSSASLVSSTTAKSAASLSGSVSGSRCHIPPCQASSNLHQRSELLSVSELQLEYNNDNSRRIAMRRH